MVDRSMKFDHFITFVYTSDIEQAANFYEVILGFERVLDQGKCRICKIRKGAYIGYCEREIDIEPGKVTMTLVTEDVDGWYRRLLEHGVDIKAAPQENEVYNIYHFYFKDPNGYVLEVQNFLHPFDEESVDVSR